MRCDANISLLEVDDVTHRPLQAEFNPKTEVKNLNSFRSVERALAFEIERHRTMHAQGEIPQGATRGWDENRGETFLQRIKETNADYRYFPEPDLLPLQLSELREEEKARLPELPEEARQRLMREWGFSLEDVRVLVANAGWADFADHVMSELRAWLESKATSGASGDEMLQQRKAALAKLAGGWITSKLGGLLTQKNLTLSQTKLDAENFAEFLQLIDEGTVNSANAQKLLLLMVDTGADPSHLLEEHNLGQTNDPGLIRSIVQELIEQNPDQVAQIKGGNVRVIKWFVGCAMKSTEGRANPEAVEEEVKKQLGV